MKKCRFLLVNIGILNRKVDFCIAYVPMTEFLFKYRHYINRVIIIDGFDSTFQGDPFTKYFTEGRMYFISEYVQFKNNKFWREMLISITE
jgi:hypothetical protein